MLFLGDDVHIWSYFSNVDATKHLKLLSVYSITGPKQRDIGGKGNVGYPTFSKITPAIVDADRR